MKLFNLEVVTNESTIVQACGAKYYIRGESLDEIDVDDVVIALVNLARRVSFSCFLSATTPKHSIILIYF